MFSLKYIGIVSKIFEDDILVDESIKLAGEISNFSLPTLLSCKESILNGNSWIYSLILTVLAHEVGLSNGIEYERKAFHSTFNLVFYNFITQA